MGLEAALMAAVAMALRATIRLNHDFTAVGTLPLSYISVAAVAVVTAVTVVPEAEP